MIILLVILTFPLNVSVADTTASATPISDVDPARQVITRADIESAGLYRVADLLHLIESGRMATVDGYTWRVSLLDGDPFGAETWTLFLDGDPVEADVFGQTNLSLLPVAITHIDSVEVWTTPRLTAGHFSSGGSIHIHTKQRHDAGVGLRLGRGIGQPTGDPGPFLYIPEMASSNVDKFGPDYEGWAAAAGQRWRLSTRFSLVRFYLTDDAFFDRNLETLNEIGHFPSAHLFSAAARLEAHVAGGSHTVQLFGGRHNDLWFFAPYGRELSTRRLFGQATVRGAYDLPIALQDDAQPSVIYRLSAAQNQLDKRFDQSLGPDPALEQRTLSAGLEVKLPLGNLAVTAGGGFEHRGLANAQHAGIARMFGSVSRGRSSGHEHLEISLAASEGDLATNAAINSTHTIGLTTFAAHGSISQRLPVEVGRLAFWSAQGYDAFEEIIEVHQNPAKVVTTTQLRLDASHQLRAGLRSSAGIGLRAYRNLYVEYHPVAPNPDELVTERTWIATSDVSGNVLHGRGSLDIEQGRWSGRFWFDAQLPIGANESFERLQQRVARYRTGVRGAVKPVRSFTASASLGFHSGSYWTEYGYLDASNTTIFDPTIPSAWLLDIAFEKWFWNNRLRASLNYKNVLGVEERYHPIGASLSRRFSLRVELLL